MIHIGPHVSSQGSVSFAPLRAKELGATGFALFTKNQRQWRSPELKEEDISAFKKNIVDLGYSPKYIRPHAGYLINPASPDKDMADIEKFTEAYHKISSKYKEDNVIPEDKYNIIYEEMKNFAEENKIKLSKIKVEENHIYVLFGSGINYIYEFSY